MLNLDNIEKKLNIKLPEVYKKLYQSSFEKLNKKIEIHVNDDIVPIAETDYEDYICLLYKENRKNPSIIYWNYDLALENASEGITILYDNMHEFLINLKEVHF